MNPVIAMNEDTELNKIRWRSRRGMLELDILLKRWLDRCWQKTPIPQREVFLTLLGCEDDILWRWLSGLEKPADADLVELVDQIRNLPVRP